MCIRAVQHNANIFVDGPDVLAFDLWYQCQLTDIQTGSFSTELVLDYCEILNADITRQMASTKGGSADGWSSW